MSNPTKPRHNQQIKGITQDMGREMKARRYDTINRRLVVESKSDMKERLGYSPDEWDAVCVLIDVCRSVLNFVPSVVDAAEKKSERRWNKAVKSAAAVYEHSDYTEPEPMLI